MLVLLEGLNGAGKSTNAGMLYRQFERNGFKTSWVHELARPHPVLFLHEASLNRDAYRSWKEKQDGDLSFLDRIVQVREETVGIDLLELSWNYQDALTETAFQELKDNDVWELPLEKYKELALEKWRIFAKKVAEEPEQVVLMDSCIFQFQLFSFLLADAPKEELEVFVQRLWDIIIPLQPRLIYLYRESVTDAIDHLRQARGEEFFHYIWSRDRMRPYYLARPDKVETYFEFMADYHCIVQELFAQAPCPKLSLEVTSGSWEELERRMLEFCNLDFVPDTGMELAEGEFVSGRLGMKIQIKQDGDTRYLIDPNGYKHNLHPRSSGKFYIHDMPVILDGTEEGTIIIGGTGLTRRWTETGLVFTRTGLKEKEFYP